MSENSCQQFMLCQIKHVFCLSVPSASGNTLCRLGTVEHPLIQRGYSFELNFIVCKNLPRAPHIGSRLYAET